MMASKVQVMKTLPQEVNKRTTLSLKLAIIQNSNDTYFPVDHVWLDVIGRAFFALLFSKKICCLKLRAVLHKPIVH